MNQPLISRSGRALVHAALQDFPCPQRAAADAVRAWAWSQGVELNPDKVEVVTLHYQPLNQGWVGQVSQRASLTQALLDNWQGESANNLLGAALDAPWAGQPPPDSLVLVDHLHGQGLLHYGADYKTYNGLYRQRFPALYSSTTHVQITAEAFQGFIQTLDFGTRFRKRLYTYWKLHQASYRQAAQIAFIAACNKQVDEGSLSDAGRLLVWQLAGLLPRPTWKSLGLKPREQPAIQAAPLNIYGYAASSLLCLKHNGSGLTLLYIPGNASPLHEFTDESAMKHWLARQCRDPARRRALLCYFTPADRPDGLSYSGVATALSGLGLFPQAHRFHKDDHPGFATSGVWDPDLTVNFKPDKYSPALTGDLFKAFTERQKARSFAEADAQIHSNSELLKEQWRGYLANAMQTLAPLVLVVPELAPLFMAGGIAQFGLGLEQTLNGKTLADKVDGLQNQLYGLFNAGTMAQACASKYLYRVKSLRFVAPQRVNGRLGYPLSGDPKRATSEMSAVEQAFQLEERVEPVAPGESGISAYVCQQMDQDASYSLHATLFDPSQEHVAFATVSYDLASDSFIRTSELNSANPIRYVAPEQGEPGLVRSSGLPRIASDAQRMRTLKGLGIDLELPLDLSSLEALEGTPIPKRIASLWVGDRVIGDKFLDALASNAEILKDTAYDYCLYLTRQDSAVYAQNVRLLREHAPHLELAVLEEQPFYQRFVTSKYFAQYRDALDGSGGVATNFSSASDVLRYRQLYENGGFHLDADDRLLAPGTWQEGRQVPSIDALAFNTSDDGLVLSQPVSNQAMNLHIKFNSSVIGSHAGNPTLDAISDEMLRRYAQDPDFYTSRPPQEALPELYRYSERLSRLSGPGMLNDVIDQRLPWLRQIREVCHLMTCPHVHLEAVVDIQRAVQVLERLFPVDEVWVSGQAHSWIYT
ncbi:mannosyltransferase [Pseudomonas sp. SDI]|uniref:dermonecrotic toxin domain-containing protein n=1 Tax=Pseudomonas sp. SDI TaxID=2170734 RepID=UPI000DE6F605|nr:DUF6543 domain-containing protein [Pseudomonas sp. SDI]PWB30105.1 mannosyltransferase [Pseudomonas sp. SDI]